LEKGSLFFFLTGLQTSTGEVPKIQKYMKPVPQVPEIFGAGQDYVVVALCFIAFILALIVWLAGGTKACIKAIRLILTEYRITYIEFVKIRKEKDKFRKYKKSQLKD
jgi:hypothetical protein